MQDPLLNPALYIIVTKQLNILA